MTKQIISLKYLLIISFFWLGACKIPAATERTGNKSTPATYAGANADSTNSASVQWKQYFADEKLAALIDTALLRNQELNITMQEIEIAKNEVLARKGEYLPFVHLGAAAGLEKSGEYTRNGAVDESLSIKDGKPFPKPLGDVMVAANFSWELDVWKKLRNAKKSAMMKYFSTAEGRNFMVTGLIAEIASSYYELQALDNQLSILEQNIEIQRNAINLIKLEKDAAKVTQLAVNRFEALLLNTQSMRYEIQQRIVEAENRINFLVGRFPQHVERTAGFYESGMPAMIAAGIPSQLLNNRPDIRQAELEMQASKLDVQVARAGFFPSFRITAGLGLQAFNPVYLFNPESILYNLAGDMIAPLVNRNAIRATYLNANARQVQAAYDYERRVLNAFIEVVNQVSRIDKYDSSFQAKQQEVDILTKSVTISNSLFRSARADYIEVLLVQQEALESRIELTEIRLNQLLAKVMVYKALGGGWN